MTAGVFYCKGQDRDGGCVLGVSMTLSCCRHMLRAEVHDLVLPKSGSEKSIAGVVPGGDLCTRS